MNNYKNLIKKYPVSTAVLSKLITTNDEKRDSENSVKKLNDSIPEIIKISENVYSKIKQNGDLLQLFPDIELCTKIVISSILCPNDMVTTNINIDAPKDLNLSDSIKEAINTIIKEYTEETYDIQNKLYDIIKESMFEKGSCVFAVIPEASLDNVVNYKNKDEDILINKYNQVTESNDTRNGILGVFKETSTESMINNLKDVFQDKKTFKTMSNVSLEITSESYKFKYNLGDRKDVTGEIILPEITDDIRVINSQDNLLNKLSLTLETKVKDIYGYNNQVNIGTGELYHTENANKREEGNKDVDDIFKILNDTYDEEGEVIVIKDARSSSRKSIGKPMFMKLPGESVIPIHAPGEPSKHIGYFVVLDENGVPIDINSDKGLPSSFNMFNTTTGFTEQDTEYMNEKNKKALNGINIPDARFEDNDKIYAYIVREMIKDKITNGNFNNLAVLNDDINLYQMMFHRALKNLKTKILFLPASLVQYFAYDFRDNGTGKSELEKMALLFSIRGTLFITSILGQLKNSIPQTAIDIELDDLDRYPQETLDKILQTFINNREPTCGLGLNTVNDIYQWIVEYQYKVNVNAQGLPAMKVNTDDVSRDVQIPDKDFLDSLAEMQYLQLGVTPEMVNKGQDVEFATTIVNNHLLLGKESRAKQLKTNTMLTNFYRVILKNDFLLRKKISNLLILNKKKILDSFSSYTRTFDPNTGTWTAKKQFNVTDEDYYKISEYIIGKYEKGMTATLPEIMYKDANAKFEALKSRFEEIDTIVDELFDTSVMETVFGSDKSDLTNEIQSVLKAYLKKKATIDNGYYTEITNMFLEKKQFGLEDTRVNIFKDNIMDYKNFVIQLSESYPEKKKIIQSVDTEFKQYEDILGVSGGYGGGGSYDNGDSGEGDNGGDGGDAGEGDNSDQDMADIDKMLEDIDTQAFGSSQYYNIYQALKNMRMNLAKKEKMLKDLENKKLKNKKK